MSSRELPPELWGIVAQFCRTNGTADLVSLAGSCRMLQYAAENILYGVVDANELWTLDQYRAAYPNHWDWRSFDGMTYIEWFNSKYMSFLRAVRDSRRRADYLRTFISFRLEKGRDGEPQFWGLFADGLSSLRNLRVLFFQATKVTPASFLRRCTFQLEQLTWHCNNDASDLVSFLSQQTSLRTLDLRLDAPLAIPADVLPNLASLGDTFATWLSFLPGRGITAAKLGFQADSEELFQSFCRHFGHVQDLTPAFKQLRSLDLSECRRPRGVLLLMVTYITDNLQYLHFHFLQESAVLQILKALDGDDNVGDMTLVTSLKALKHLRLSDPSLVHPNVHESVHDQRTYIAELFQRLEYLEMVDVQEDDYLFRRYFRDGTKQKEKVS